jgi:hypothetical protein
MSGEVKPSSPWKLIVSVVLVALLAAGSWYGKKAYDEFDAIAKQNRMLIEYMLAPVAKTPKGEPITRAQILQLLADERIAAEIQKEKAKAAAPAPELPNK